jgi:TRAP-type mannitol/chloroaromatic compound transport system substrate-binding protein
MLGLSATRREFLQFFSAGTTGAVLAACAAQAPATPTTAKPATEAQPAAPAAAPPTTAAAAPAAAPAAQTGQALNWKVQTAFGQSDIFHQMSVDWAKKVEEMSGGRIKMDLLPIGAVVQNIAEVIDAVSRGTVNAGVGVPAYWFGKSRATSLFGTGPSFGMDADQLMGWVYYGGGMAMYDELIQKNLNLDVQSFFFAPMPTQPLGWFKQEITSADQFRGLKYRTVGLSADLFKEMGAAVTILGGPDIVPALERGVIDAAEFNNPSSDKLLGFADVAKILMVQSYHQPVEFVELLINKRQFDALPASDQALLRYAATAQSQDSTWKYFYDANSKDYAEYKQKGVKIVKTPQSILQEQLNAWTTIVDRESQADPFFGRVIESQKQWAARVVPLRSEIMVENQLAYNHFFGRG